MDKALTFPMRLLCAIVFCTFTFCYLYFYQADIMVVAQHIASGGKTHYVPLTGAVLITVALLLIQILVYAITGLYKRTHALTYFPSALLLLFLTSIPSDIGNEICLGAWVYVFPLALIVFGFGTIFLKRFQRWEPEVRYFGVSSQLIWINLGILLLLLLMVGCLSNSDEAFHRQARMERLIQEKKVEEAIVIGQQPGEASPSLTLMRAYALSLRRQMGESFFEGPVTPGSASLIPTSLRNSTDLAAVSQPVRALLVPSWHVEWVAQKGLDIQLTKLLMDGKLDAFARMLQRNYDVSRLLPKHYREALVLYNHVSQQPLIVFHSNLDDTYADFLKLKKAADQSPAASVTLKNHYGNTYWYYYFLTRTI